MIEFAVLRRLTGAPTLRPGATSRVMTARKPFAVVICGGGTAGARWLPDPRAWVDPINRTAHTATGVELAYDALLHAVGGRELPPAEHMDDFDDHSTTNMYGGIVEDIDAGRITKIAYVRPEEPSWPLPLYELALLTADWAREVNAQLDIAFITREPQPLHAFGREAGKAIVQLFHDARIDLHTSVDVTMPGPRHLILQPGGTRLYPDRTIRLPTITGPNIRGISGGVVDRFVSVDVYCRVRHTDGRIVAAGAATDVPLNHLSAHLIHDDGNADGSRSEPYDHPPWLEDEELVAAERAPYLRGLRDRAATDQTRPSASRAPSATSGRE